MEQMTKLPLSLSLRMLSLVTFIYAIKEIDLKDEEYRNVASNEMKSLKHENILGCLGLYSAKNEIKILMDGQF
jgi:hypothetical protein